MRGLVIDLAVEQRVAVLRGNAGGFLAVEQRLEERNTSRLRHEFGDKFLDSRRGARARADQYLPRRVGGGMVIRAADAERGHGRKKRSRAKGEGGKIMAITSRI